MPKEAAIEQFTALEAKGTSHGKYFNIELLINAMRDYLDKANYDCFLYNELADKYFNKIAEEQKRLPVNIADEFRVGVHLNQSIDLLKKYCLEIIKTFD